MWSLAYSRRLLSISLSIRNVGYYAKDLGNLFSESPFIASTRSLSSVEERQTCDKQCQKGKGDSITVSYLVNSCGLPLESAKSRSEYVRLFSPEKPDSVLKLLKSHGLNDHQIAKVIKSFPQVLVMDPENVLLPKLKFFSSIGLSSAESAKVIASCPKTLSCSLHCSLIPCYEFLKSVLAEDEMILKCLKVSSWILLLNVQKDLAPKVSILRHLGVLQTHIKTLFRRAPGIFYCSALKFDERVKKVTGLGFEPTKAHFTGAIMVVSQLLESTWERRIKLYKKWGWSEDEVFLAFRKHPRCMKLSDEKITSAMDFLVNKMGLQPSIIAKCPLILGLSLEKRIVPRCLAIANLVSKGILKEGNVNFPVVLKMTEKQFVERYVIKYQIQIPQLSAELVCP